MILYFLLSLSISQTFAISFRAVSQPIEKSDPGTLFEIVQGMVQIGIQKEL